MIKHLSKKMITLLGTTSMVASLGMGGQLVKADTTEDPSSSMQSQLDQNKDLQAYKNPLIMANLTTKLNVLPEAQSGVANWNSLPAGTIAVWNKKPDLSTVGTDYGQIIVTFPDGSSSALAVYVKVEANSVNENTVDNNNSAQAKTESKDKVVAETPKTSNSVVISQTVKKGSNNSNTVKKSSTSPIDVANSNVNDNTLPQSNMKTNKAAVVAGLLLGALSIAVLVKNRKVQEND